MYRWAKQMDKTTEIEIIKAELEERQFGIKVGCEQQHLVDSTDMRS